VGNFVGNFVGIFAELIEGLIVGLIRKTTSGGNAGVHPELRLNYRVNVILANLKIINL
jgi:hypothetical protein